MNRSLVKVAGTTVAALAMAGCFTPDTYQPPGTAIQHAVYAGKAAYPYDAHPEMAPHLFCSVAPDLVITIYNAGDESYNDFELWVNKQFTLHIDKLDARSKISISPNDLYNSASSTLANASVSATSINTVELYIPSSGKLLTVQGPILPH